MKLKTC